MANQNVKLLAVLIDAENVPASCMGGVFQEIEQFGRAVVRRAYGDFNGPQAANWEEVFSHHSIVPHHQFSFGRGKNAADIALAISAMDLLHDAELDGFCIVSSDSDFMPLAVRIREQDLDCYIIGNHRTPDRVRRACTRFVYIENLRYQPHNLASQSNMKPLRPVNESMPMIRSLLPRLADNSGSWVKIEDLERELDRQFPDFDPRTYGHLRLRDLLIALGRSVIVDAPRDGDVRVRLRAKKKKKPRPTATKTTQVLPSDAGLDDSDIELGTSEHGS